MTPEESLFKKWRPKKDTSCLLFPTFPFSLWPHKGSRAIDGVEVCESGCRMSEQILDTLSRVPKNQAKGSSVCIQKSCREWVSGLWGDKVLWRGTILGRKWRITEMGSGVTDERDGCLVLCLWLTACSCGHHCGHAHLHTFGRSSRRQHRPRGAAPFKMEAKGQASKHSVYADTYPYIIWTTVHKPPLAKREKKACYSNVNK